MLTSHDSSLLQVSLWAHWLGRQGVTVAATDVSRAVCVGSGKFFTSTRTKFEVCSNR